MGEYFEGDNYIALRLGTFEPGTKITLAIFSNFRYNKGNTEIKERLP